MATSPTHDPIPSAPHPALVRRVWVPAEGHPAGPDDTAWFDVVGSMVYPSSEAVVDVSSARADGPWFQYRGELVFAVAAHPAGPSAEPWFLESSAWLYRCGLSGADAWRPWYAVVELGGAGTPT